MRARVLHAAIIASLTALLLAGCPQQDSSTDEDGGTGSTGGTGNSGGNTGGGGGGGDSNDLTSSEKAAVSSALKSAESLSTGAATAQSPTDFEAHQSSADVPGNTTFGTCPEVTLSGSGTVIFTAQMNFGAGCSPFSSANYFCSGSATGSYSSPAKSVDVSFDGLTCNGHTLAGTADLTYDISAAGVNLNGTWDVTYTGADGPVGTEGTGAFLYNSEEKTSTFTVFEGQVSYAEETWTAGMDYIQVSYTRYGNFIPFNGDLTVSSDTIRSVTIRFSTDSPAYGTVQVSIADGPFVRTTIDNLLAASD